MDLLLINQTELYSVFPGIMARVYYVVDRVAVTEDSTINVIAEIALPADSGGKLLGKELHFPDQVFWGELLTPTWGNLQKRPQGNRIYRARVIRFASNNESALLELARNSARDQLGELSLLIAARTAGA